MKQPVHVCQTNDRIAVFADGTRVLYWRADLVEFYATRDRCFEELGRRQRRNKFERFEIERATGGEEVHPYPPKVQGRREGTGNVTQIGRSTDSPAGQRTGADGAGRDGAREPLRAGARAG